ncbi:hypothetical protein Acor_07990 [Acrocarpospora corrugata]|uniref:MalT-like TPR region domain-containing protein n=1 Tax=Acrocarpospora corrugata TaxID=35763 RepID=A0A5M3VPM0_9ACTN|nr:hypothetical protein [Acrocarpospora corrugata]GER98736.1 hypothetical protein Acor_07990 [Acrocarpospora corrugata]
MPERLLGAVANLESAALFEALRELVENHLLLVDEGGQGYAFRHALARDAVYHDMLPGERAQWHVAYARALSAGPELTDASSVWAQLAHHWFAALDLPAALPALLAAARASSAYAPAEESWHLERALEIWPRVPDAAALTGTDLVGVLTAAGDAAWRTGSVDRSRALFELALAESDGSGPVARRALLMARWAETLRDLGQLEESVEALRSALDLMPPEPLEYAHAVLLTSLTRNQLRGDFDEDVQATAERAVAVSAAVRAHAEHADALVTLGSVQAAVGNTETGMRTLAEGLALAERIGAVETVMRARNNSSDLLEMLGRHQEAVDTAALGLELARRTGTSRTWGAYLAGNLVEAMYRLGRWREAEQTAGQSLRGEPEGVFAATLLEQLAQISVLTGRREEAARLAGRAKSLVIDSGDPQFLQPLAFSLAEARRLAGDLDGGLAIIQDALTLDCTLWLGRYSWPLVWLGTRIAVDRALLARDRRAAGHSPAALASLAEIAGALPRLTPAATGYALTTAAERTASMGPRTSGRTRWPRGASRRSRTRWPTACSGWPRTGAPPVIAGPRRRRRPRPRSWPRTLSLDRSSTRWEVHGAGDLLVGADLGERRLELGGHRVVSAAAQDEAVGRVALVDRRDDGTRALVRVSLLAAVLFDHGVSDVLQHRMVVLDALLDRLAGETGVRASPEGARFHGQDLDSQRGDLLAQDLGHAFDGVLGGGVVAEPGHSSQAGHRGHVDDPAAAAGAHAGQDRAGDRQHGEEVQFEQLSDGGVGHALDRPVPAAAGVVDQDVDAAEVGFCRRDGVADLLGVGDVEAREQDPIAVLSGPFAQFAGPAGGQCDAVADLQRGLGEGHTEAAGCASSDEPGLHALPPCGGRMSFRLELLLK